MRFVLSSLRRKSTVGNLFLKERHTIKKLMLFLTRLVDIQQEQRESFVNKLEKEEEYSEGVFEKVLLIIDRLDETKSLK